VTGESALALIAEVSVGLAGFSGIVLVLARRESIPWDAWRTLSLLGFSLGALTLSMVPFGLSFSGVPEPDVWRLSSAAMTLYSVVFSTGLLRLLRHLDSTQLPYYRPVAIISSVGSVTNTVAQLLNSLAVVLPGTLGPFFWGLVWLVIGSAGQFTLILFVRPRSWPAA